MSQTAVTHADLENLSEEELAALKKAAVRQLTKIVMIKVGTTVAIAVAASYLTKKLQTVDVPAVIDAVTE